MDSSQIYKCLESIANLSTEKNSFKQSLKKCLSESKCIILSLRETVKKNFVEDGDFEQSYSFYLSEAVRCLKLDSLEDENFMCAIYALYLLHYLLVTYEKLCKQTIFQSTLDLKTDGQGENLISIQKLEVIQKATKYIMYTSVLSCLDSDSSLFMKIKMIKENFAFLTNVFPLDNNCELQFLKFNLKVLIPLFKNPVIGEPLRSHLLGELLSPILFLSFSPTAMKELSEDVPFFRSELEFVLKNFDQLSVLQVIILTKMLANNTRQSWLQKCCHSLFIRRFLLKENGVSLVLKASLSIIDSQDWKKKEAVASLISSARAPNEIEFYENIGTQIVSLILQKEISGDVFQIIGFLTYQLNKREAKLTKKFIFMPILMPLILLTEEDSDKKSNDYDVAECVSFLYKLYVEMMMPSPDLGPIIETVLCPLFHVSALPPTCYVKTKATLIIVRYLNLLEPGRCIESLLVLCGLEYSSSICPVISKLTLSLLTTTKDGIYIAASQADTEIECLDKDVTAGRSIIDILDKLKSPSIVKEFYQRLLCYLDFTCLNHVEVPGNLLLTIDDKNSIQITNVRKLHMAINLLSLISENQQLIEDLFHDFFSAAPFLESLLNTGKQVCNDEELSATKESLLMNCIMMIFSFINVRNVQKKMSFSDWQGLNNLLPTLDVLQTYSSNAALIEYIDLLKTTIFTHGVAVEPSFVKSNSNPTSGVKATLRNKSDESTSDDNINSAYEEAIADVCSPHLPIRGHALLSFAKLLDTKDGKALKNKKELLALFEHHLKDEDSYIYLMAVQGLVSLSEAFPDKIIPILTYEVNRGNLSWETRVKMVEVLTQATKRLGPLLPKYTNIFINSLLTGAKDENEFVRASCISNLAEVCKELRFSVGPIIQEIFTFIHLTITGDKSVVVRRAGVLVITLLFRGLGKDSLKLFQSVILDIYRALKHLIRTDTDPALVLQAGLAIEEINTATKEFLLPNLKMEKKIYVTELPPKF